MLVRKKTASAPESPPWEPCDRLVEQQHPVAPIREPSERRFQKEMSQFLRTVAKEANLSSVWSGLDNRPPGMADSFPAGHCPTVRLPPYCKGARTSRQ